MNKLMKRIFLLHFLLILVLIFITACPPDPEEPETVTVDFNNLTLGTIYNVGDTFTSNGVRIILLPFENAGGWTLTGYAEVVAAGPAGGSGLELWTNNINIGLDAGSTIVKLSHKFGEYGGNINVQADLDYLYEENFNTVNFPSFTETITNGNGQDAGDLTVEGTIDVEAFTYMAYDTINYAVGGQEASFDDFEITY